MEKDPNQKQKRPEEYIAEIIDIVKLDVFKLIVQARQDTFNFKSPTDHEVEEKVVAMTISLSKGLKDLVHYSKHFAIRQYNNEKQD